MKLTKMTLMLAIAATPVAFAADGPAESLTKEEMKDMKTVDVAEARPGTLADVVADGVTFSILEKAIETAGLSDTFVEKGPMTVFAPTDEAFQKLPKETLDALMLPENKEKLRTLLLFHVVHGQFLSGDLSDTEVKSASGDKIEVDVDGTDVEVEDSKVVKTDVMASNGVVHVIDKVMVPKSLDGFADLDEE